jgi:hypothetical protein
MARADVIGLTCSHTSGSEIVTFLLSDHKAAHSPMAGENDALAA